MDCSHFSARYLNLTQNWLDRVSLQCLDRDNTATGYNIIVIRYDMALNTTVKINEPLERDELST